VLHSLIPLHLCASSKTLIERGVLEVLAAFADVGTMADLQLNAIWALKVRPSRLPLTSEYISVLMRRFLASEHRLSIHVERQVPPDQGHHVFPSVPVSLSSQRALARVLTDGD
jgi:hypothetical protein